MESVTDTAENLAQLWALLDWQVELGATEAICDSPVNRFETASAPERDAGTAEGPATNPARPAAAGPGPASEAAGDNAAESSADPVAAACAAAASCGDLDALRAALAAFSHCELRRGARNLVFADGKPGARVMILGEAPGRDEDLQGLPFVGRAGRLLDRMFAEIGLARSAESAAQALYISNVSPWRPPQNRDPTPAEIAMLLPFVERHVALAAPEIVILMGNTSCQAMLGRRGITRLRGGWTQVCGRPALPMFHPAYLLRNPHAKREVWADLLALQARLEGEAA